MMVHQLIYVIISMQNYQNPQENQQLYYCLPINTLYNVQPPCSNPNHSNSVHPLPFYSNGINIFPPFSGFPQSSYSFQSIQQTNQAVHPTVPSFSNFPQERTQRNQENPPKKRVKNLQKQIESAKKNAESNLVNHFFSFFSHKDKSEHVTEAIINSMNKNTDHKEKLFHLFYNTIHAINSKRGRKYINMRILQFLILPEQIKKEMPEIKDKVDKTKDISLEDLCLMLRKSIFYFYRSTSLDLILTSKRISSVARSEHLKKKRRVSLKLFTDFQ